jgi:hypothetical protein
MLENTKYWHLIDKLKSLNSDQVVDDAIEDNLYEIVKLNQSQLEKGEYVSGNKLPDYSDVSVELFGKPDGPMTLKESGYYYGSMEGQLAGDEIRILSDPIKIDNGRRTNIEEKYGSSFGEQIKGLQEGNKKIIREKVKDNILIRIRRILFRS